MVLPWKIEQANWQDDKKTLTDIRYSVFVVEQSVPVDLEVDDNDEGAKHWLAIDKQGNPVGTIRLLANGHIGRLSVLKNIRGQGAGNALLEAAITEAKLQKIYQVYLYSQVSALAFYSKQGFEVYGEEFLDAGIPHQTMRLRLFDKRLLGIHGDDFAIHRLQEQALEVIGQTEKNLRILSFDLDHHVFDNDRLAKRISTLARKSRFSNIRILVADTSAIVKRGHRLLNLYRRLPSKVQLRKISCEPHLIKENLILADQYGIIVQSIKEREKIWGNYNNQPVVNNHINQFDELWNRAREDNNLRQLDL